MFVFSAPVLNVGHRNKNLFTITTRIVSRNFGKAKYEELLFTKAGPTKDYS